MKPRIALVVPAQCPHRTEKYRCHDNYFINGFGNTPLEAYNDWKRKESQRTIICRTTIIRGHKVGWWARKGALDWWGRGCPTIRYYIGNKQVVGFLPDTDELVLRG